MPLIPIPCPAHSLCRRSLHETATAVRCPRCGQRTYTAPSRYVCRFVGPARVLGKPGWSSPLCSCSALGLIRNVTRLANRHVGLLPIDCRSTPHVLVLAEQVEWYYPSIGASVLVSGQTLPTTRSDTKHCHRVRRGGRF